MPMYKVTCRPNEIEGTFEADDAECAVDAAMDDWITSLGPAADAIMAGSFDVRLVEP